MRMDDMAGLCRRNVLAGSAAALVALATGPGSAEAQSVEEFYEGNTITIYVGFSPGGGYDSYGRLAAEFLGRHIPGNPEVIVENRPGAGGRIAAQFLYNVAPKDGTALAVIVQSVAMDSALGTLPGDVDAAEYDAIGRLVSNYELGIAWHDTGIETFEDTLTEQVEFASTGAGSASSFVPAMLNDVYGAQYNVVAGYSGVSAARLALEQGEVDAMMSGLAGLRSSNPEWLNDGLVNVLWQLSLEPHPEYPDVPAIGQLGKTEDEKAMFRLVAGAASVGRSLVATPDVPEDRLAALREAFSAMVEDPEFIAAAEERNLELDTATGEELQSIIADQMDVSDAVIEMTTGYVGIGG